VERNGFELSTDPARIDVERVHRWLSGDAYWGKGRPYDVVARSIANSLVFGVYRAGPGGEQVAFARVVTDGATFAWLCDVYVERTCRGAGIGTWLATAARDALAERGVHRIFLGTFDAHGVYAKLGFAPLDDPSRYMVYDRRPRP
jgi:GNAT superfamily N-acetyltransferase